MSTNSVINTSNPIAVASGGTGLATLTAHSVQVGAGTSAITQIGVGASGSVLLGATGADPAFALLTSTGGSITYTTGANALNLDLANYASTTWTPVLTFGGGSTGITYSTQVGIYTRIANMVFIDCNITLTSKGSSTGTALVTGLPVTANATSSIFATRQTTITYTGQFVISTTASATTCAIEQQVTATTTTALTDSAFANSSAFRFTGVYFT